MAGSKVKVLFTDLGGVILTNGWDRESRAVAVEKFKLDSKEYEGRHQLMFGDYETGKISLETYLKYTVFYQPRDFMPRDFMDFMYAQSKLHREMIDYVKEIKNQYRLKVMAISNEGRELTHYRLETFNLKSLIDDFLVSCFVGIRKPDRQIYRLALDIVQEAPENTVYLEDRQLFVDLAHDMGIKAFRHVDLATTRAALSQELQRDQTISG